MEQDAICECGHPFSEHTAHGPLHICMYHPPREERLLKSRENSKAGFDFCNCDQFKLASAAVVS